MTIEIAQATNRSGPTPSNICILLLLKAMNASLILIVEDIQSKE